MITVELEPSHDFIYAICYKRVIIQSGDTIFDAVGRMSLLGMACDVALKRVNEALEKKFISLDDNDRIKLCFKHDTNRKLNPYLDCNAAQR